MKISKICIVIFFIILLLSNFLFRINQRIVLKCRIKLSTGIEYIVKSLGIGSKKFILQTLVTFAAISLLYNIFISFQLFPLFTPLPCLAFPSPCASRFKILYDLYQQDLQIQTMFGLLFGILISITLIPIILRPQKQLHSPLSHYLLIGSILGAGIGSFLGSIPARWQLLQLTHQILTASPIHCSPGCNLINYHFLVHHSNYLIILGIPLITALFLSLNRRTTRPYSTTLQHS